MRNLSLWFRIAHLNINIDEKKKKKNRVHDQTDFCERDNTTETHLWDFPDLVWGTLLGIIASCVIVVVCEELP